MGEKAVDHLRKSIPTEFTTLHWLLGSRPDTRHFRHSARNPLPLDVLAASGNAKGFPAGGDGHRLWYPGRPVLVTRNDCGLGLMNGDIGITLVETDRGQLLDAVERRVMRVSGLGREKKA